MGLARRPTIPRQGGVKSPGRVHPGHCWAEKGSLGQGNEDPEGFLKEGTLKLSLEGPGAVS